MARRMQLAHQQVARACVTADADISCWWPTENSMSLMLRLMQAIGVAVVAEPILNSRFDDQLLTLTPLPNVDLGIAMELERGLLVPVMRDIQSKSPQQLSDELNSLRRAARERTLTREQLREPSLSLSNYGAFGGRYADMVVVPPQVAIVGAGRAQQAAAVRNGELAVSTLLPLSLSFDHRVLTGAEACRFLSALVADLRLPASTSRPTMDQSGTVMREELPK